MKIKNKKILLTMFTMTSLLVLSGIIIVAQHGEESQNDSPLFGYRTGSSVGNPGEMDVTYLNQIEINEASSQDDTEGADHVLNFQGAWYHTMDGRYTCEYDHTCLLNTCQATCGEKATCSCSGFCWLTYDDDCDDGPYTYDNHILCIEPGQQPERGDQQPNQGVIKAMSQQVTDCDIV